MLGGDLPAGCRHGPPSPGTAAGCTPCCPHRQHLSFPGTLQSKGSSKTGFITTSLRHWQRFWHTINTIGLSGKNTEMATTVLCMFSSATNLNLQKFSLLVSIFFFPLTSVFAIGWALTGPSAGKTAAGQRHPWQLPPPGHITSEHSDSPPPLWIHKNTKLHGLSLSKWLYCTFTRLCYWWEANSHMAVNAIKKN